MPLQRLPLHSRGAPVRYGTATAIFAVALWLRLALLPVEARAGFLTFYPAIVLVFYLCGTGAGLWVVGLSAFSGFYIFYPPFWSWVVTPASALITLSFVGSSLVIALVMRSLENTTRRLGKALASARISDARWRAMVEDQSDIVLRFDAQGSVLFANEAARRMFGEAAREADQGRWRQAVHPEDLPKVLERIHAMSPAHPLARFDCRVMDVDARQHWVDFVDHGFHDDAGRLLEVQSVGRDVSERKALEQQLQAAETELRDLYDNAPCGYYSIDAQGRFLRVNKALEALLASPASELLQLRGPGDFTSRQGRQLFEERLRALVEGTASTAYELDLVAADGSARRVRVHASAIRDAQGSFVRTRSAMVDITELRQAQQALEGLVREQHAMLDNDLVGIIKLRGRTALWVNAAFARMFGYEPAELVGRSARLIYPDDTSFEQVGLEAYPLLRARGAYRRQVRLVKKSGEPVWVDMSGTMLSSEHDESMWMMLDISALKAHEQHIEALAYRDTLTGLPNRFLLVQLLERELATHERLGHALAVCFMDLDGFKPINDSHGHEAGDRVLRLVGERLLQRVRGTDIVARLGGDEFIVVLTHLADAMAVGEPLQRLLEYLAAPIPLQAGAVVGVSASLGVAVYPQDGKDVPTLLRHADHAMYAAKDAGRNQLRFHAHVAEGGSPA